MAFAQLTSRCQAKILRLDKYGEFNWFQQTIDLMQFGFDYGDINKVVENTFFVGKGVQRRQTQYIVMRLLMKTFDQAKRGEGEMKRADN